MNGKEVINPKIIKKICDTIKVFPVLLVTSTNTLINRLIGQESDYLNLTKTPMRFAGVKNNG